MDNKIPNIKRVMSSNINSKSEYKKKELKDWVSQR